MILLWLIRYAMNGRYVMASSSLLQEKKNGQALQAGRRTGYPLYSSSWKWLEVVGMFSSW